MDYLVDDAALDAAAFLALANSVWPGEFDVEKTRQALSKTLNITAYHQGQLIGCLRILTDGCYFGTITEVLVLPAFQKQGVAASCSRWPGPIPRPAILRGQARSGRLLRKKWLPKGDAGLYHPQGISMEGGHPSGRPSLMKRLVRFHTRSWSRSSSC